MQRGLTEQLVEKGESPFYEQKPGIDVQFVFEFPKPTSGNNGTNAYRKARCTVLIHHANSHTPQPHLLTRQGRLTVDSERVYAITVIWVNMGRHE